MCGLFAVMPVGNLKRGKRDQLRNLVLWLGALNDARGGHSWGMWGRDAHINKGLGHFSSSLRQVRKYLANWRADSGSWLGGHTRYATHGGKTVENAHPFRYSKVTLAHNGVMDTYGEIKGKRPEVDSAEFALFLSEQIEAYPDSSFEEVFKASIAEASGTIGLLIGDEVGNLRVYVSFQDLHMAVGEWGYAISSSKDHLETALDAAGLDFDSITRFKEDMLTAPWYPGYEDTYAPSMYLAPSKKKSWTDYQDDQLGTYDRYYAGSSKPSTHSKPWGSAGSSYSKTSTAGVYKKADIATVRDAIQEQDDAVTVIVDGDLVDPISNTMCELCETRKVGPEPAVWKDPDSGRAFLICSDCAACFGEAVGEDAMDGELSEEEFREYMAGHMSREDAQERIAV